MAITYSLLGATFVRAVPAHGHPDHTGGDNGCNVTKPSGGSCNLSYTRMNLPAAAQAALGVESGPPQYVAYGKGTQVSDIFVRLLDMHTDGSKFRTIHAARANGRRMAL